MASIAFSIFAILFTLIISPFLIGIIVRVKAKVAGRTGRPLLQLYYDLAKLIRKEPVYPACTTWTFTLGPILGVSATIFTVVLIPFGSIPALISFSGDVFVLAGFLALSRFGIMLSALDVGSAFEGMGTAREALFSALIEPVFVLFFAVLAFYTNSLSLTGMVHAITFEAWGAAWPFFLLLAIAIFLIMLTENTRIPVDDPTTHLELTMIHEVMILDHSGPELALYEYAAAVKMFIFGLIFAGLVVPQTKIELFTSSGSIANGILPIVANFFVAALSVFFMALLTGIVESVMARLRLERVPQLISLAGAFVALAGLTLWG